MDLTRPVTQMSVVPELSLLLQLWIKSYYFLKAELSCGLLISVTRSVPSEKLVLGDQCLFFCCISHAPSTLHNGIAVVSRGTRRTT